MREWGPVTIIALLFVIFSQLFSSNTPYRESGFLLHQRGPDGTRASAPDIGAPDERQHANYVRRLMDGKGFPVLESTDPNLYENYQAHQPPLFYILSAGFCQVLGVDPTVANGKHCRDINTVIGLGTLFGIFFGCLWLSGSKIIANCACAYCILPMNLALHGALSNDPLLICLCTWTIALLAKYLSSKPNLKILGTAALLTGLALLTKTTAIALLPCLLFAVLFAKGQESKKPKYLHFAILVVPILIALPWWIRNVQLYGDFLAVRAFTAAFTGSPQASVFINAMGGYNYWINMVLWWTVRSAIGVFGYMDIFLFENISMLVSNQLYLAILFVVSLPLIAGIYVSFKDKPKQKPLFLTLGYSFMILLLFVRFNSQYFQGQARYLYPAIAPVAWISANGMKSGLSKLGNELWLAPVILFGLLDLVAVSNLAAAFAIRQ